jgi:hypothetical protein
VNVVLAGVLEKGGQNHPDPRKSQQEVLPLGLGERMASSGLEAERRWLQRTWASRKILQHLVATPVPNAPGKRQRAERDKLEKCKCTAQYSELVPFVSKRQILLNLTHLRGVFYQMVMSRHCERLRLRETRKPQGALRPQEERDTR